MYVARERADRVEHAWSLIFWQPSSWSHAVAATANGISVWFSNSSRW